MTTRRLLVLLLLAMTVTVAVARSRTGVTDAPGTARYAVTGVVTTPPADGRVMVAHEAIADYMPAMTMPFAVQPDEDRPALAPGDRVRFTLVVTPDASWASGFEVTGHDPAVAAALRAPASPGAARLRTGDPVPAFSLTAQDGRPFTAADLAGRRTAVTFIFTRCPQPEFCPLMVKRFQQVQRMLLQDPQLADARLLAVTLDPEFDTPPVLAAYGQAMQADPTRWTFATGGRSDVAVLTRAFAVHSEKNGVFLDHTLATAVIDENGRVAEIWRGNHWSAMDVVAVLRAPAAATD